MREIKFRGMDIQGRWFVGNLAIVPGNNRLHKAGHYISNSVGMPFAYQVRPETVGQYTGLKDCDGKEIYEGDIVTSGGKVIYRIEWVQSNAQYFLKVIKTDSILTRELRFPMWQYTVDDVCAVEVIGNIYTNADLLEDKHDN